MAYKFRKFLNEYFSFPPQSNCTEGLEELQLYSEYAQFSPIVHAALFGSIEMLDFLLCKEAGGLLAFLNTNLVEYEWMFVSGAQDLIFDLCWAGRSAALQKILQNKHIDVNAPDRAGFSPIWFSIRLHFVLLQTGTLQPVAPQIPSKFF